MMTEPQFTALVDAARAANPLWFELEADPPASDEEIRACESALGATFPAAYRSFLARYGGGEFAFASVYSVRRRSEWNVVARNPSSRRRAFIAVSDNGAGDEYGFAVDDGRCGDAVFLWDHETNEVIRSGCFADLFEMLARRALRSS